MTGAASAELISSLVSLRDDVERHVAKLDRYRALRAIEQTISDFPGLEDLNHSLSEIRERMQRQIEETREFRALQAVEKIVPELTEVLAFLTERSEELPASPAVSSNDDVEELPGTVTVVIATTEDNAGIPDVPPAAVLSQPASPEPASGGEVAADPGEAPVPANDAVGDPVDSAISEAPAMTYGIAQFLNPDAASDRSAGAEPRREDESPYRSPPSQEGRAA